MRKHSIQALILITMIACFSFNQALAKPHIVSPDNLGTDAGWAQFGVSISTDKKTYRTGDHLIVTIKANKDCNIMVYYTNEIGNCLLVYPNKYEAKSFIRAGEQIVIGDDPSVFWMEVREDRIRDYLQVIATSEPIDISSLTGIRKPEQFVNKLRLILKEMVMEQAQKLGNTSNVSLDKKVFAIGTTDYTCNMPYTSAAPPPPPPAPTVSDNDVPEISVRSITEAYAKTVKLCGPDAPQIDNSMGDVYEVDGDSAMIRGTVEYKKGVRTVILNGKDAQILPAGGSKSISLEGPDKRTRDIVDFIFTLEGLTEEPVVVKILAEGMDGKNSQKEIRIRKK
jgi:hypothetical protein